MDPSAEREVKSAPPTTERKRKRDQKIDDSTGGSRSAPEREKAPMNSDDVADDRDDDEETKQQIRMKQKFNAIANFKTSVFVDQVYLEMLDRGARPMIDYTEEVQPLFDEAKIGDRLIMDMEKLKPKLEKMEKKAKEDAELEAMHKARVERKARAEKEIATTMIATEAREEEEGHDAEQPWDKELLAAHRARQERKARAKQQQKVEDDDQSSQS